jgi:hypothetical protein
VTCPPNARRSSTSTAASRMVWPAQSRRPGPFSGWAGDGDWLRRAPAVTVTCERGEQMRPPCSAVTAWIDRAVHSGRDGPHRSGSWAGCHRGWHGATASAGLLAGHPPHHTVALLAGRAYQLAHGVCIPARSKRSHPVVCFPQRGRVGEPGTAARDVTPGAGHPYLVTDDTVLGNRYRINQRVAARRRWPCRNLSRPLHQPQLCHPVCPARQRPGMPGQRPWVHRVSPHRVHPTHKACHEDEPKQWGAAQIPGVPSRPILPAERQIVT